MQVIIENKIKSSENDKYKNLKSIIYMENPTSLIIFKRIEKDFLESGMHQNTHGQA